MRPRDASPLDGIDLAEILTPEELAQTAEEAAPDQVEVWPEAVLPLQLYAGTVTQWNMGMGGPTGINDTVIDRAIRRAGIRGRHRRTAREGLRTMESETLKIINERAAQQDRAARTPGF